MPQFGHPGSAVDDQAAAHPEAQARHRPGVAFARLGLQQQELVQAPGSDELAPNKYLEGGGLQAPASGTRRQER
jgi:hypothetical protein